MLWVYIIAAVGLVGIMVETWLSYRKEAAQMQSETVHVRSGIRQNEAAATGIENKRHASDEHTAELKVETEKYTAEVELKARSLRNCWSSGASTTRGIPSTPILTGSDRWMDCSSFVWRCC